MPPAAPIIETHTVPSLEAPVRLSDYAGGIFTIIPSRKGMKKAIRKGLVTVDGRKAGTGTYLRGGETIALHPPDDDRPVLALEIPVIYEDDHLAMVVKPAGIVVSGNAFRTLENALPANLRPSPERDALPRPYPVHRLDFPTTGILLVGKTGTAIRQLKQMFADQEVRKVYHAISVGRMDHGERINTAIDGKTAQTEYSVLESVESGEYGRLNLMQLIPHTGRRHQIRIHLCSIGHPILGDRRYWRKDLKPGGKGLYLHATSLAFPHPVTGIDMKGTTELPAKFRRIFPAG